MQLVESGCLDLCAGFPWQPDREPFQGSSTEAASSLPNIFIQYYRKNILPLLRDYFHLSSELCKTIFPAFPKIFFLGAQLDQLLSNIDNIDPKIYKCHCICMFLVQTPRRHLQGILISVPV